MSSSIYSKLAITNIKNNRKTYFPYILTAILTVGMYYIMDALAMNTNIVDASVKTILFYAVGVVGIFAVIFLFYTNSFLIKRRKRELGVYNILGMGKRHIAKMLGIETVLTAGISMITGIAGGIVFSKLLYLVLLKIMHYDVGMEFEISTLSLARTVVIFVVIFGLTLIYNLFQIQKANPTELLSGSRQGEREPKAKILLAIFGVITMGIGYGIALTTESPLQALSSFFVAVVCVILGTYALFTAGSIALLKILKKNKAFYYKSKHFTSVSGMIYRMKQNAAGLANICILSTMVLVLVSTSVSLYAGMNDILDYRFPNGNEIMVYQSSGEREEKAEQIVQEETQKAGVSVTNKVDYRRGAVVAGRDGKSFEIAQSYSAYTGLSTDNLCEIHLIPLDDYNRIQEKEQVLEADEVLLYTDTGTYGESVIELGSTTLQVKKELKTLFDMKKSGSGMVDGYYVIVRDETVIQGILDESNKALGEESIDRLSGINYAIQFGMDGSKEDQREVGKAIQGRVNAELPEAFFESRCLSEESFYSLYGSLLFIGIYLGILFLVATVLIIYYKQISEGYDDRERYQIMQKVGMSKPEVKRSIRSQVLTVFFLPLIVTLIHIAVAFPVLTKLLAVLNLMNVTLFLICTIITAVVFAVFYAIVFAITAREYYKIVN